MGSPDGLFQVRGWRGQAGGGRGLADRRSTRTSPSVTASLAETPIAALIMSAPPRAMNRVAATMAARRNGLLTNVSPCGGTAAKVRPPNTPVALHQIEFYSITSPEPDEGEHHGDEDRDHRGREHSLDSAPSDGLRQHALAGRQRGGVDGHRAGEPPAHARVRREDRRAAGHRDEGHHHLRPRRRARRRAVRCHRAVRGGLRLDGPRPRNSRPLRGAPARWRQRRSWWDYPGLAQHPRGGGDRPGHGGALSGRAAGQCEQPAHRAVPGGDPGDDGADGRSLQRARRPELDDEPAFRRGHAGGRPGGRRGEPPSAGHRAAHRRRRRVRDVARPAR